MDSTIKSVKLLYPSLMKDDADQQILDLYKQFEAKEEERTQCFMRQQVLEKEMDEIRKVLLDFRQVYSIEYEEEEKKEKVHGEAPVIVESNGTIHV